MNNSKFKEHELTGLAIILKRLESQDEQLEKINSTMVQMAIQGTQIVNLQSQMDALFNRYDLIFGPTGLLTDVKSDHASLTQKVDGCPGKAQMKSLTIQVKLIWMSIFGIAMGIIAKTFNT